MQTCTLPSFQDFCKALHAPKHNASRHPFSDDDGSLQKSNQHCAIAHFPVSRIIPPSTKYICPYAQCGIAPGSFARWDEFIHHGREHHSQLFEELLCKDSMTGDDAEYFPPLAPTRHHTPVSPQPEGDGPPSYWHDVPSSPVHIGWFDPSTERAQATINFVNKLTRNELHHAFWETASSRPMYGDQPICKKMPVDKSPSVNVHDELTKKERKDREAKKNHMENERERRLRHFVYQSKLHRRQPDVTHRLADQDEEMLRIKKSTSSKGPGKDDQFVSNLYMHHLSAIVVQSEHEGRKNAERRVEELERQIEELRHGRTSSSLRRGCDDSHYQMDAVSPSKRQRTSVVSERATLTWKGKGTRLPPSPSPSPSLSSGWSTVSISSVATPTPGET